LQISIRKKLSPSPPHPQENTQDVCSQALQISIRKKLSPSVSKTPKMFANLYKKKEAFPSVAETPKIVCKSQNKCFSQVF